MNLGGIYLNVLLLLTAVAFALSFLFAWSIRFWRRIPWIGVVCAAFVLGIAAAFIANKLFHQPLFVAWHQAQNDVVPQTGCVTYEPDFTQLYATYRMSREGFDAWVAGHSWRLKVSENGFLYHDGPRLGFSEPEASFETEIAPNGKQLRVYFKSGMLYLPYNSM